VLSDNLGSINAVINAQTNEIRKYSYSAWGIPRDPDDWTNSFEEELFSGRGFTGHEHLSEFDLINMNGRVYDPVLARFLSPDPFVQFPGVADGYNRYAYVMNNPLRFTDPSGYSLLDELKKMYNYEGSRFMYQGQYYTYNKGTKGFDVIGMDGGILGSVGGATYYDWVTGTNYFNGETVSGSYFNYKYLLPNSKPLTSERSKNFRIEFIGPPDYLGSRWAVYEDPETGKLTTIAIPFFQITGSYYNELYYFSGLVAYDVYAAGDYVNASNGRTSEWVSSNSNRMEEFGLGISITSQMTGLSASQTLMKLTQPDASTNLLKKINIGSKYTGNFASGLSLMISINNYRLDQSWGNAARIGVNGLAFGLSFGGPYTAGFGFGLSVADSFGAFIGFYDYLNFNQELYDTSGLLYIPSLGISSPFPWFIKL